MAADAGWHGPLTRLARLAQDEPEANSWIERMLVDNMPEIAADAISVALETGGPVPHLLAKCLAENPSIEAAETVARTVPMKGEVLQDAAIEAAERLLAASDWPRDETERGAALRRYCLRVGLASRLAAKGSFREAETLARQAVAGAEGFADQESAQARLIDAYDVLSEAALERGDSAAAAEHSTHGLGLRLALEDPQRIPPEGRLRLAEALVAAGVPGAAVDALADAAAELQDMLDEYRDPIMVLEDAMETVGPDDHLKITVRMAWNPSGFDELAPDSGWRVEPLRRLLAICLFELTRVVRATPHLPSKLLARALGLLAKGRVLLRKGEPLPLLEVEVLVLLGEHAEEAPDLPSATERAEALEQAALHAAEFGDGELAIRARAEQADCLRQAGGDGDNQDLVNALQARGHLLDMAGRPEEAVAVTREAAALAGEADKPFVLHNLGRRLAAAGRPREAFEASSQAVALLGERFPDDKKITPLVMGSLIFSLGKRAEECDEVELEVTPLLVGTTLAMLDRAGLESGSELERPVLATYLVIAGAERSGDLRTAGDIYEAILRLASRRPDDRSVQYARSLLGSNLLWKQVEKGNLDEAHRFYREVAAAAGDLPEDRLIAEHGKAGADMIHGYQTAGDSAAAREVAREARHALLSMPYLKMREADLGDDQTEFAEAIEALADSDP